MTADFSKLPSNYHRDEAKRRAALPEGQRLLEELFREFQESTINGRPERRGIFDEHYVEAFAQIGYAFAERWRVNDVLKAAAEDGQLDRGAEATDLARSMVTLFLMNTDANEIQAELLKFHRLDLVAIVYISIIKGLLAEMSRVSGKSIMEMWRAVLLVYERRDAGVPEPPMQAPDWWNNPEGPSSG